MPDVTKGIRMLISFSEKLATRDIDCNRIRLYYSGVNKGRDITLNNVQGMGQ